MPYVPPAGSSVELKFLPGYAPPPGASVNLEFDTPVGDVRQASAGATSQVGAPGITQTPVAAAKGTDFSAIGDLQIQRDVPRIYPEGIDNKIVVGTPEYVRWPKYAELLAGIPPPIWPLGDGRVRLVGGYNPPPANNVILNWFELDYTLPPANHVVLEFGALGYGHILGATLFDQTAFGNLSLHQPTGIRPPGIPSDTTFGKVSISLLIAGLRPVGIEPGKVGEPHLGNAALAVYPKGFRADEHGKTEIYNSDQYLLPDSQKLITTFGDTYVQGGVKYVLHAGKDQQVFGALEVINTMADQAARPPGIKPPEIAKPAVSPRMVYPEGIVAPRLSDGLVVQFPPWPEGWDSLRWGRPTIDYWTKYLSPGAIDSFATGYPSVRDRAQKIFQSPVVVTTVFGDIAIRNVTMAVHAAGFDTLEVSEWANVRSNLRRLLVKGWESLDSGETGIRNKTPSLIPPGIDALSSGTPAIGYVVRYLYASGWDSRTTGHGEVTQTPSIAPPGFAGEVGEHTVWYAIRTIEAPGFNAQELPGATVWFRYRFVSPTGEIVDAYGEPRLEHSLRNLDAKGRAHDGYGRPWISNADRLVAPPGIFEKFASDHMVGGTRWLRPAGYVATRFGERIIPPIQNAYPLGFTAPFGWPDIHNDTQLLSPPGFLPVGKQPADHWGKAKVYNSLQFITLFFDPNNHTNPPAWPKWTLVENRNKVLRTTGKRMDQVARPEIANTARLVRPDAIAEIAISHTSMVAYRVRREYVPSIDPPYFSTWSRIYNGADVVHTLGFDAQQFGRAGVVNTRRYFPYIGGQDFSSYGTPMVAFRVRTLTFERRYTIGPPLIRLPEVKLYTRYVDGIGDDLSGAGIPDLVIHWNKITPRWTPHDFFGWPALHNVTPELHTRGRSADVYGDALVRLEWRPVAPDGKNTQLFGRTIIAFRDRSVFVRGQDTETVSRHLTVIRLGAPPYSTQNVSLDDGHYGIDPPPGTPPPRQVGEPILNQQVVYVHQEKDDAKFGDPMVAANGIRVEPGINNKLDIGEPWVSLYRRRVTVDEWPDAQVYEPDKPRISPWTIWAMTEAPAQAKQNYPPPVLPLHPIDGYRRQPGVIFGRPAVTLENRTVYTRSNNANDRWDAYGRPDVQLRIHYVEPRGINSFRMGWHEVPGTRYLEQFDATDTVAYGRPTVAPPPYHGPQNIQCHGLNAFKSTGNRIENFNRDLPVSGFAATRMGESKPGDTPYMWQGLRVGPRVPFVVGGDDASAIGEHWASFRVREVKPGGFNTFLSEYQLEAFEDRMRVIREEQPIPSRRISPVGFDDFAASVPNAMLAARFIRPDGNAEQYRKGAPNA